MTRASAVNANCKQPVLLIEDEPSVMAYMRAALERHGYQVAQAASGAEGLSLLAQEGYCGIISDMRTPGGVSGAEVHAWIAQHRPEMLSKILFTTGDTANDETAAMLRNTGAPCIEKPFRVRQFLEMVERVIGKPQ